MHWFRSEPSLAEMLSDPIVRALMAADRVVPEELRANLAKIAGTLELRRSDGGLSGPSAPSMHRRSDRGCMAQAHSQARHSASELR